MRRSLKAVRSIDLIALERCRPSYAGPQSSLLDNPAIPHVPRWSDAVCAAKSPDKMALIGKTNSGRDLGSAFSGQKELSRLSETDRREIDVDRHADLLLEGPHKVGHTQTCNFCDSGRINSLIKGGMQIISGSQHRAGFLAFSRSYSRHGCDLLAGVA